MFLPVRPCSHRRDACRAFTLVEVLVVVAVLSVMLVVAGSMTGNAGLDRRLNSGAQFVYSKLNETRGVAAMRLTPALLLVHADPAQPELMWQSFVIVAETEIGSGTWVEVGTPARLPPGVCWVPPAGVPGWTGPVSDGGVATALPTAAGAWAAGCACWAYEFSPAGRIKGRHYDLFVAEGSTVGGVGALKNPKNHRGLRVNAYGHVLDIADMPQAP